MSPSFDSTPQPSSVAPAPSTADPAVDELDVQAASADQLVAEWNLIRETIRAANLLDPTISDLIRREQAVRREIGRREVLLMQGILWTTEPESAVSGLAGYSAFHALKTRNGRGGPGGPGDWDD